MPKAATSAMHHNINQSINRDDHILNQFEKINELQTSHRNVRIEPNPSEAR